jgi:HK97 gp10 family phage protein
MAEIHVKGLAELSKFLDALPVKIEKNIMRSALRQGAKVIQQQAIANVPVQSGELRKSLKIGTRVRGGTVTAAVKTKVFYAKFVEFGTKAHFITARKKGWLSFGGIFAKSVQHPGSRPRPFLRPALDAMAGAAVIAVGEQIKKRLTKEGLDTAHITIEGDE